MWRTRPCDRRDPGTGNGATNSKLPRPSIKAASDHAGPLRTPFPSRRLRFLKPRQVVVCLVEPRSNGIALEPAGCLRERLNSRAVPPENRPVPQKVYRRPVMRRQEPAERSRHICGTSLESSMLLQDRLLEEWLAALNETRGNLSKFALAIDLLRARLKLNFELSKTERKDLANRIWLIVILFESTMQKAVS